jgi:outer membrane immunogenic protein
MKRISIKLLGLAIAGTISYSAEAADIYAGSGGYKDGPYYTWSGFYAGLTAGGAWQNVKVVDVDGLNGGGPYSLNGSAAIGGAELGINWQSGQFVYGLEFEVGGLGGGGTKVQPSSGGVTYSGLDNGVYGEITGRFGFAFGRTLLYAKGGYVFDTGQAFVDNSAGVFGGGRALTGLLDGWTLGGGVEYLLSPAWSIKVEYQHFDFGKEDAILFTPANGNFTYSNDVTVDTVKFGVNYHLGHDYAPLK